MIRMEADLGLVPDKNACNARGTGKGVVRRERIDAFGPHDGDIPFHGPHILRNITPPVRKNRPMDFL